MSNSKPSNLLVGQKVLLKDNHVIGKGKLQNKYKEDVWVIEDILDQDCGLYKVTKNEGEVKVLHRNNLRPMNERLKNYESDGNNDDDQNKETCELPDMKQILAKFGISREDLDVGESSDKENDWDVKSRGEGDEVLHSQGDKILRRSERIKQRMGKHVC